MPSRSAQKGKGLSFSQGLFLVIGYHFASLTLGLAVALAAMKALYPGIAERGHPAIVAALSVAAMTACWLTMPANRPHMGALTSRVVMLASLVVGAAVARRLLFGRGPALGGEVFVLIISAIAFGTGLCVARGTRWGRKWAR